MAANEVLARVADVASSDLLDFIHATGRDGSLSTTSVNRRGPPSMPRAELGTVLPTRQGSTATQSYDFGGGALQAIKNGDDFPIGIILRVLDELSA